MDGGVGAEKDLKEAGAEALPVGRCGIRIKGWTIESCKRPILGSLALREWEEKLGTSHLPEMVFGESFLNLLHMESGIKIHFNAFDALKGWKQESLPPVEVPAAANWKFRSKPFQQIILDYDYTFTTPYSGSETIELNHEKPTSRDACHSPKWDDCEERIDVVALSSKEPILFYDEVILYEDELADNGISLLTVKVRVMPSCWFLLLRFWLRVDGVLMRLRDSRFYCVFSDDNDGRWPDVLRESCWREATIGSLSVISKFCSIQLQASITSQPTDNVNFLRTIRGIIISAISCSKAFLLLRLIVIQISSVRGCLLLHISGRG